MLSPLLANVYLHWFDKFFHSVDGPAHFAKAKLVRYADDFVVLARYQGPRLLAWVERTLENRLGLTINRAKTRVVNLNEEGVCLTFLGYQFRYDRDQYGRGHRYLNQEPAVKSVARARERVKEMTGASQCFKPVRVVVGELNRYLRGWRSYFGEGYPRKAFRKIGGYVRERLIGHLRRRSQRPFRPAEGTNWYQHLTRMGLEPM